MDLRITIVLFDVIQCKRCECFEARETMTRVLVVLIGAEIDQAVLKVVELFDEGIVAVPAQI